MKDTSYRLGWALLGVFLASSALEAGAAPASKFQPTGFSGPFRSNFLPASIDRTPVNVVVLLPGASVDSDDAWKDYIRATAITYHHQVGTAKMGTDELAVVDPQLRVYGVEGLRVADASVMPTVTSGNTNAASLMIGERVAALVAA